MLCVRRLEEAAEQRELPGRPEAKAQPCQREEKQCTKHWAEEGKMQQELAAKVQESSGNEQQQSRTRAHTGNEENNAHNQTTRRKRSTRQEEQSERSQRSN